MLTLKQYGITLTRIDENNIELIRYWRNQSDIITFMEHKSYITPCDQKKWFSTINNKLNYYFIIEFENKKIGLINVKNYSPNEGFGEGGIFIWDKNYLHSFAPAFSSLCLLNFMLVKLNVCKKSRIRVLKNNQRAIDYNKMLGYKLLPNQEMETNQLYELDIKDYLRQSIKLNNAAKILSDSDSELKYDGDICEKNIDEINQLLINKTL
jgi:UDP-4-amino-4,6-dideoxy-N-acetyl-beta-L-altrosamine N-acetyltransferase